MTTRACSAMTICISSQVLAAVSNKNIFHMLQLYVDGIQKGAKVPNAMVVALDEPTAEWCKVLHVHGMHQLHVHGMHQLHVHCMCTACALHVHSMCMCTVHGTYAASIYSFSPLSLAGARRRALHQGTHVAHRLHRQPRHLGTQVQGAVLTIVSSIDLLGPLDLLDLLDLLHTHPHTHTPT